MKSLITDGHATPIFRGKVLGKHEVQFYRCDQTGFIQTENPYWLEEAYQSAITALDIGLLQRNVALVSRVGSIIDRYLDADSTFLDYAGGYGIFVRMMRDRGYDFRLFEPICENLFANHFEIQESEFDIFNAEMVTAFELLEHLSDPIATIDQMFQISDTVLCSTMLVPDRRLTSVQDWWYFTPETGQHIAFYTYEALERIASRFNARCFSDGRSLHLLTRAEIDRDPFHPQLKTRLNLARWHITRFFDRRTLIPEDLEMLRRHLQEQHTACEPKVSDQTASGATG